MPIVGDNIWVMDADGSPARELQIMVVPGGVSLLQHKLTMIAEAILRLSAALRWSYL